MPPSSTGTMRPQESGQSGTDCAASLLVTSPPAITSKNVQATNTDVERRSRGCVSSKPLTLIGKIDSFAFLRSHRDLLFLNAELLVPCLDSVGSGRQSFYCKRPTVPRHSEEGMGHNSDIGAHPRVHVAFHRHH